MWVPPGMTLRSELRETWLSDPPRSSALPLMMVISFSLAVVAAAFWQDWGGLAAALPARRDQVFDHGEYYRLWSALFVHADPKHLLSNLLLLFPLGYFLAGSFGVLVVPVSALLAGGLINALVLPSLSPQVTLIGISGLVFWLGGAWLTLYLLLERRRTLFQRSLRAFGVGLLLFLPGEAFDPSISYASHFWGFVLGVLWALLYFAFYRRVLQQREVYELILEENAIPD